MALKSDKIKNAPRSIPLLDIGDVPLTNIFGESTHSGGDTLNERALRWQVVFEAQLEVDWNATTAATHRKDPMGVTLQKYRTHVQDMQNLKTDPLSPEERTKLEEALKRSSPGLKKEEIDKILENGKVVGCEYRKPERKNNRIYMYRYVPDKIFEDIGYRSNLPDGCIMVPQMLMYKRKDIQEFKRRFLHKYGKRAGRRKICWYCHEPFLSRKHQEEPYVCQKPRCRKAKVRMKNK